MVGNRITSAFRRFKREEEGVALVEFAVFLPLFMLSFFVIVEFSRIFFSYQAAVVGVRDATRYLGRVINAETCVGAGDDTGTIYAEATPENSGGEYSGSNPSKIAYWIIERNMWNENDAMPSLVNIVSVSTSYNCVVEAVGTYRQREVPIARVFATIEITLPLGGILELNGLPLLPTVTSEIYDESRIYGV